MVLVHGSLSDMRTWEDQIEALASRYRVIAYSRRYCPPNPLLEPGGRDPMEPHVDDLLALIRALDAGPAHLVGDSWGAFIALLAAMRQPATVRSLVLAEPPALSLYTSTPPKSGELLSLLLRRPRTALAIVRFGAGVLNPTIKAFERGADEEAMTTFARGALGNEVVDSMPEEDWREARENLPTLKAQLPEGFPPLPDPEVRGVQAPTLLVSGERTRPFFRVLVERLEELLPGSERLIVPDATHSAHLQNPDDYERGVLDFLDRVD